MSVISSLPAVPNRVAIVYRFLQGFADGIQEDELKAILSPSALKAQDAEDERGSTMADYVLREARALHLVETEGDVVRVPPDLRGMNDAALLGYLERTLLDPVLARDANQEQFPRALAWLLVQDPARPLGFGDNQSQRVVEDCGIDSQSYELTNKARFQNLVYWAQYFGYVWRFELGRSTLVVPDPTPALDRHIRAVLRERKEVPVGELVTMLAERSPVLENGSVRREVEELLPSDRRRPGSALSRSTSLALLRLRRRGTITLERRADAPVLGIASWPDMEPVSHIILRS